MDADALHHQLLLAFNHSNHAMVARTRAFGLLPGQPKVLEFVAEHEGCLQRDIARACAMDRATVTGVLGRMEAAGLITRTPRKSDRRALEVKLTEGGRAAAARVVSCGREVDDLACAGLSAAERQELSRLLTHVIESFEREERGDAHE